MKRDYSIASVNRVLDILEFLSQQKLGVGLPEASRAIGIPKSTLFRYLSTLIERGYVRKSVEGDEYSLGFKALDLSRGNRARVNLIDVAQPHMRDLLSRYGETVNLAVLDGNQVVYVKILESPHAFKLSYRVGGRDHAHTTALGKSILAFLPHTQVEHIAHATSLPRLTPRTIHSLSQLQRELGEVRERGYASDEEENELGVCCVGAPVFDGQGSVVAAISISSPAVRVDETKIREMGASVYEASHYISHQLGYNAAANKATSLMEGDTDLR